MHVLFSWIHWWVFFEINGNAVPKEAVKYSKFKICSSSALKVAGKNLKILKSVQTFDQPYL